MTIQPSIVRGKGRGRPIDETGKVYGRWTVLGRAGSLTSGAKSFSASWLCRCECGGESVVRGFALREGSSTNCGCVRTEKFLAANTLPAGQAATNRVLLNIKGNARRRGLEWAISDAYAVSLLTRDCHYCGSAPASLSRAKNGNFAYNGIDRTDNVLGYVHGNVVPCCAKCNSGKMDMTVDEFLRWVANVHEHSFGRAVA